MEVHLSHVEKERWMIRKLKQKYKDLKYRYKTTLIIVLAGMLPVVLIVIYMQIGMLKSLREQETGSRYDGRTDSDI